MALPTLDKSWTFNTNLDLKEREAAVYGTYARQVGSWSYANIIYSIKAQLVAWGWTVERSSKQSSYGPSDLWAAYTDVNGWNSSPSSGTSWIVLKKADAAGVSKDLYLLITCFASGGHCQKACIYASYSTFTGGTTLTRPTSPGEFSILRPTTSGDYVDEGNWIIPPSQYSPTLPALTVRGIDAVMHAMRSSDGECERILVCVNNVVALYFSVERIKNPVTGMTHPLVITWTGDSTAINAGVLQFSAMSRGGYYGAATGTRPHSCFYHNGSWGTAYWGTEAHVATGLGERVPYANEIDNGYVMCPVSLVSDTPALKGHHGFFYDLWWGSIEMRTGDTYPGDETAQFVKFTDNILPWDGSAPVTV